MSAAHAAFEMGPESLDGVGVRIAFLPLLATVVHRIVFVAHFAKRAITLRLVGADPTAFRNEFFDDGKQGRIPRIRHDVGHEIAAAFDHAKNRNFVISFGRPTDLRFVMLATADVCLVNFDMASKSAIAIDDAHKLANLVTDAPCGLIGHAQLPLKLLGGHPMAGRRKQVHRIEPKLQRCSGALKGGTGAGINMMPTELAAIGRTVSKAVEFSRLAALHTISFSSISQGHDMAQTSIVIRESLKEVLDRDLFHVSSNRGGSLANPVTCVKGIHTRVRAKLMSL